MTEDAGLAADVDRRIGLAAGVARSMTKLWSSRDIGSSTKVRLYKSLVLSVLLYNSETWTMKEDLSCRLFEMTCFRNDGLTRKLRASHAGTDKGMPMKGDSWGWSKTLSTK